LTINGAKSPAPLRVYFTEDFWTASAGLGKPLAQIRLSTSEFVLRVLRGVLAAGAIIPSVLCSVFSRVEERSHAAGQHQREYNSPEAEQKVAQSGVRSPARAGVY